MPVFKDKKTINISAHLFGSWYTGIRKDVTPEPWIGFYNGAIIANAV